MPILTKNVRNSVIFGNESQDEIFGEIVCKTEINGKSQQVTLKVMNLKEKMILGWDLIQKFNLQINTQKKSISIEGEEIDKNFSLNLKVDTDDTTKEKIQKMYDEYEKKIDRTIGIKNEEFKLILTENKVPKEKNYSTPLFKQPKIEKELKILESENSIRKSNSAYGAPMFTEEKTDGTPRILVDYREVNKITEEVNDRFSSVTDELHKMKGAKIFSKFDLRKGFYQVKLREEDIHKTAFTTHLGKYEWLKIPMGLKNPPKVLHNIIARTLEGIEGVGVFVDDIIVYSSLEEEHIKTIQEVLNRLSAKNVLISKNKNCIAESKIKYLGFEISEDGYEPDQSRLENFSMWKKPTTKKQLQELLGKLNWYRPFLKNLSEKLAPFYEKLKTKSKKIKVEDEEMKIVANIHEELKSKAVLYFPDINQQFFIEADACDSSVGAVLYKTDGIIAYFSKTLNDAQKKYSTYEKECLAILWATERWYSWIGGTKTTVYTDNKNLISNTGQLNKNVERWKAKILQMNIEFKFIKGKNNVIADELSRKVAEVKVEDEESIIRRLNQFHIENGHPGQQATIQTLKALGQLGKGESKIIKNLIRTCEFCQLN